MAWSKVTGNHKKPIGWWFHKILCEYGWIVRKKDNYRTYYGHLNKMAKYGFNLYGQPIIKIETSLKIHPNDYMIVYGFEETKNK